MLAPSRPVRGAAGATGTFTYDLLGRATAAKQADGTAAKVTYDQVGDPLTIAQTDTDRGHRPDHDLYLARPSGWWSP
ncbi:MAG: hypothetical protein JWN00_101 [Actinomycetia bacterium]|nr:hypothetical protein [Actinomycetes bacterium]